MLGIMVVGGKTVVCVSRLQYLTGGWLAGWDTDTGGLVVGHWDTDNLLSQSVSSHHFHHLAQMCTLDSLETFGV